MTNSLYPLRKGLGFLGDRVRKGIRSLSRVRRYLVRWALVACLLVGGVLVVQRLVVNHFLGRLEQIVPEAEPSPPVVGSIPHSKLAVDTPRPWFGELVLNWPAVATATQPSEPELEALPKEPAPPFDPLTIAAPVRGEVVAGFGWQRHPQYGDWRYIDGVIFSTGVELVAASAPGVAYVVGPGQIRIEHGSGWETIYEDVDVVLVSDGQRVPQGQTIGRKTSAGSGLLTWKVIYQGQHQDPSNWVFPVP